MNPFIILTLIFLSILVYRVLKVIQKSSWPSTSVVVQDIDITTDHNGCLFLNLMFQYDDRFLSANPITIVEEFTDLSSTRESITKWLQEEHIIVGKRINIYYNPTKPATASLKNHFTSKDHSQIIVWSSLSMISMIIAILVSGPR